ncbi:unnamed protein product [Arctogadus glacialis]
MIGLSTAKVRHRLWHLHVDVCPLQCDGAPFDFTVTDVPALRKWWCIMLIENFDLGSHGKLFAHWTDASKALLRGEVPPVFKLKKRRRDDIHEGPLDNIVAGVAWLRQNAGLLRGKVVKPSFQNMDATGQQELLGYVFQMMKKKNLRKLLSPKALPRLQVTVTRLTGSRKGCLWGME